MMSIQQLFTIYMERKIEKAAYLQFVNKDKDIEGRLPPMCQYVQGQRRSLTSNVSVRSRT